MVQMQLHTFINQRIKTREVEVLSPHFKSSICERIKNKRSANVTSTSKMFNLPKHSSKRGTNVDSTSGNFTSIFTMFHLQRIKAKMVQIVFPHLQCFMYQTIKARKGKISLLTYTVYSPEGQHKNGANYSSTLTMFMHQMPTKEWCKFQFHTCNVAFIRGPKQ